MKKLITYIGLDVHKSSISVAIAAGGLRDTEQYLGVIANTHGGLSKLARKLSGKAERRLCFCYEAGPCGTVFSATLTGSAMTASWWRRR